MELIKNILKSQREFFYSGETREVSFRIRQLHILKEAILKREKEILKALEEDLNKPAFEGYSTEIGFLLQEISFVIKHLGKWAKHERAKNHIMNFPSTSYIIPEPYGISLVMSPWNYPFQLAMAPLVGSISAGNCTIIKPSEYASSTSKVIAEIIKENYDEKYIAVIEGDKEVNTAILKEKFDKIFFTGSVAVGKIVMEAASKHLTPVTLELGGKSPCIVDNRVDIDKAARRIAWGKFVNAGQTCIAPDYVYVHRNIKVELIENIKKHINSFYGDNPQVSEDFPRIINVKHHKRLVSLLSSGRIIAGGEFDEDNLYISPTLLDGITWDDPVMEDEIFGPILPIMEYEDIQEVIDVVNNHPKPLALYVFSNNKEVVDKVLRDISFGGGCVNDTMMHVSTPYLPFGGVGESGVGGYHGKATFDVFSHKKSILKRGFSFDPSFKYPPYGDKVNLLKKLLK